MSTYNEAKKPKAFSVLVESGSGFGGANLIEFDGLATFLQITSMNNGSRVAQVKLNNDPDCVFNLYDSTSQVFSTGDIHCSSIDFAGTSSGGGNVIVEILVGLSNL